MTFLYQKSRCLIEAFSLHLKHLLLFLPTTMYEGSKYKIIYEIMDDKVYILRVIHHSQNITNNFFLAENEIPYVVESD